MKAVTVAGGSSEDPKIEGTTVAGADPDDTSTDPDTEGKAGPGEKPEPEAGPEAGQVPEPASGASESPSSAGTEAADGGEPEAGAVCDEGTDTSAEGGDTAARHAEESDAGSVGAKAPEAESTTDAPDGTNTDEDEDAAPKEADATRVLKMPARSTVAPHDARAAAPTGPGSPTATSEADAPGGTDTEDDAPEASDATRVLKMPARATTAAPDDDAEEAEGPTAVAKAPKGAAAPTAEADAPRDADADGEAPEGDDVTRVLTMPPRATARPKAAGPKDGAESGTSRTEGEAEAEAEADGTLTLTRPKPEPSGSKADGKDGARAGQPGGRAEEKNDKDTDGKAEKRPAAHQAVRPLPKADGAEPEAGRSAAGDTARKDGDGPRVPGWARAQDTDSERTSQFVALRDLDVPPPVPARPQPQPQATPQPLPPLDLLADLTNTPAPPQTPRRTALRRVKVWTPVLLLLAGACIGGQMLRPLPDPRLVAAETEHTVDGQFSIPWPGKGQGAVRVVGSGDIGTFGEQKPVPTASVAKVMTAYVILKNHPLRKTEPGPDITVDAKTVADGNSEHESRITGLTAGSKFSQQDMLKMLMIPSGNNIARLLARWDTGTDSEAAFVEKMNAAARELGMKDTTYTDPSGLDAGTVSTAADQLKLAEAVMKDEAFRAIVALPEAPIKGLGEKLVNNNHLLTDSNLSIRGIKTGSSTPAGGTFVWAAYKTVGDETRLIVGSLMEQRAPAPDKDALQSLALVKTNSKKIIESVRTGLASTPLVRKGDTVGYVDDGLGGRTPLVAVKDLNVISVPGQRFKLSLTAGASPLPRTAKAGTEVAVLTAGEGEGAKSVPVAVQGALAEPSFGTRITRLG
ncbi:serine hydrolase [Streptomyces sp. NPDC060232]|uniref:D-alanyl-D-alanine carboxypeptidase n=1 Tax=Streptomyces sp. NPDC060232 TaxID=3347079 RepID=UPI00366258CE